MTVSVIIFSDILVLFAVSCFSSLRVSLREKPKESKFKGYKALALYKELNDNLSEAYLELSATSMREHFC